MSVLVTKANFEINKDTSLVKDSKKLIRIFVNFKSTVRILKTS
jgi:hypothetical protein